VGLEAVVRITVDGYIKCRIFLHHARVSYLSWLGGGFFLVFASLLMGCCSDDGLSVFR
jgi:hypothetical protein